MIAWIILTFVAGFLIGAVLLTIASMKKIHEAEKRTSEVMAEHIKFVIGLIDGAMDAKAKADKKPEVKPKVE